MEIRFLPAGCGDAIHIRFVGNDSQHHNILIDGGAERRDIYDNGIRQALVSIADKKETIDLWIITHIDDDHIGGILRFIQDKSLLETFDLNRTTFWYNAWHSDYQVKATRSSQKSVEQGVRLRQHLKSVSHLGSQITDKITFDFHGANLTVLSPSAERLGALLDKWENSEAKLLKKKRETKKAAKSHDYGTLMSEFDTTLFKEDGSDVNGSSIAFILSHQGKAALFSGDSHPSVLCNTLRKHGYSESKKLKLDLCQVPHHGSKFNTNAELVQLIDCNNFVISANGYNKSSLPNKETLARIIQYCGQPEPFFHITHKNPRTSSILTADKGKVKAKIQFAEPGLSHLLFRL